MVRVHVHSERRARVFLQAAEPTRMNEAGEMYLKKTNIDIIYDETNFSISEFQKNKIRVI